MTGVILLTVPHSGTHFLRHYLEIVLGLDGRNGVGNEHTGYLTHPELCDFVWLHTCQTPRNYAIHDYFSTAIVPLRHPYKTIISECTSQRGEAQKDAVAWNLHYWLGLINEVPKYKQVIFYPLASVNPLPYLLWVAAVFGRADHSGIIEYAKENPVMNRTMQAPKYILSEADKQYAVFAVEVYEQWISQSVL